MLPGLAHLEFSIYTRFMERIRHPELIERLSRVIDKILYLEKSQVFEVGGVRLYPSEVHLVLYLAKRPGANATTLADHFGVTKGAISQTLTRLQKKGVITKERDRSRRNELILGFTELGRRAVERFNRLELALIRRHDQLFDELTPEQRQVVAGVLDSLLSSFDQADEV